MPDILTHLIGADEALKTLGKDIRNTLKENRKIYNLGAQGPDLFFYHRIFPWQKTTDLESMATRIHKENINLFFINAANLIRDHWVGDAMEFFRTQENTDVHKQFAYLAGFLTHYALDTHVHPYIYYFSGHEGGYNHKYFECILDTLMNKLYDTKKMKVNKTGRAISLKNYDRFIVSEYLALVIEKTFLTNIDQKDIQVAIKDMKNTMNAMYDPKSLKKSSLKAIDQLAKAKGKIATARYPAKLNPNIDYFNLKHNAWCHPTNQELLSTSSFLDCVNEGISYASQLIKSLSLYMTHQIGHEAFLEILGNKLYDTGLEASLNQTMHHSNTLVDFHKTLKIKDS